MTTGRNETDSSGAIAMHPQLLPGRERYLPGLQPVAQPRSAPGARRPTTKKRNILARCRLRAEDRTGQAAGGPEKTVVMD